MSGTATFTYKIASTTGYEAEGEVSGITPRQYAEVIAILNGKPLPSIESQQQTAVPLTHVLRNPRTGAPIWSTNNMNDRRRGWWFALHKRAGVDFRSPKQTRHTFASTLLMRGESLLWVSKVLGHKKPTTTLNHYARFIPSDGPIVYTPRAGIDALFSAGGSKK